MMVQVSLVIASLVAFNVITTESAVSIGLGECPDGHKPGESWYPAGGCQKCDCHENQYSCYTCGVYAIDINTTVCYHYRDESKPYPDCCTPITKCQGDDGFDATMLQIVGK